MALRAAMSVGSQALPYQRNDPTISCTCLICASERGVVVSGGSGVCTFAPYWMGVDRYMESATGVQASYVGTW